MVWARTSWRGKIPLVSVDNKINAAQYVGMLEKKFELLWKNATRKMSPFLKVVLFITLLSTQTSSSWS